mmetsp:Transcript_19186/g.60361  ORF Transcript_19186/g.60361 Transcript_19186/m.60361 type:complete len:109 (-) Transcript_19186:93-419(-)
MFVLVHPHGRSAGVWTTDVHASFVCSPRSCAEPPPFQDVNDNELVYFESIHLFVELLDQFFGNVCELDLVFNFNKVYMILDEFFLAGEVQETSKQTILHRVQDLDKLE